MKFLDIKKKIDYLEDQNQMIIQGIANRSSRFGSSLLFYSFAIIFIYFGIQKPTYSFSP